MVKNGSTAFLMAALGILLFVSEATAQDEFGFRARGIGYAPPAWAGTARGRLMAERAAQVVATRNLVAQEIGAPVPGFFQGAVSGVRVIRTRPAPGGGVEAVVETSPRFVYIVETHVEGYPE